MIIAIVKDLYAVLENKKCKSTELGTLIWSDQSSEVLDACQLLITGKKKKKPYYPFLYYQRFQFYTDWYMPLTVTVDIDYH